jgi:hypothetical protein
MYIKINQLNNIYNYEILIYNQKSLIENCERFYMIIPRKYIWFGEPTGVYIYFDKISIINGVCRLLYNQIKCNSVYNELVGKSEQQTVSFWIANTDEIYKDGHIILSNIEDIIIDLIEDGIV